MGKKKSVTFDVPSSPPHKPKKEKNIDSEIEARQKHINNLLETKKELENKIKMAASKKKKSLTAPNISPPLSQEVVCCVPLCTNTSFVTKNKIFFPFPMVKKLSKQWVQNVGRKGFNKQGAEHLHQNYKVCSDHFEPQMFLPKTKNKVLLPSAIPTIFESIHEPEISITTGPPVKRKRQRKAVKPPIIENDFEYDEDLPLSALSTLLPPKLSMKKKLVKSKANTASSWTYRPSVPITRDGNNDDVQSSGTEEEYEECDLEDADPNDPNFDASAPKRRKMGTRRKPKETLPLTMECYSDELSPAQKEAYATATKIYEECKKKLDELAKMKNAKLVFNNEEISAYEIDEGVMEGDIEIQEEYGTMGGLPVSTNISVIPGNTTPTKRTAKQATVLDKTKLTGVPAPQPPAGIKIKTLSTLKPQESTSIGGLFSKVNKSTDGGSTPDSKEVAFNKLAGKTYPSLVVIARPSLKQKEPIAVTNERAELDAKVKAVLLYSSNNLTEWLIQQGLLRSDQHCSTHFTTEGTPVKLKLGMYSDVTKFPHSGGYVWISECCPAKFVSVFYNSIFEGAPHTPSVLVKLMYHWACQTSIGNVTSWVKIDNLYLKTFYSYMRCVCTGAVHEKHDLIGGPMKKVEVGVISLGTTNVDGNLRQVKVEVLGVLETDTNKIRLRAIEPLPESERNQKKRFAKIMEPLRDWVHSDSAICTDFTVDKSAFLSLGFKNVYQVSLNDANPPEMNNKNIMEYLRRVVPRMFQNTLSLLSRHIIQQFLDELVWRERFGPTPARAFESIVQHLAEQTRLDTGGTLLNRYQKISVNPFANWKYSNWNASCAQPVQEPKPYTVETSLSYIQLDTALTAASQEPSAPPVEEKRGRKRAADRSPLRPSKKPASSNTYVEEGDTSLDVFYYGTLPGKAVQDYEFQVKYSCPTCSQIFSSNLSLLTHLQVHSVIPNTSSNGSSHRDLNPAMCRYCLKTFTSENTLEEHMDEIHIKKNIRTKCLICEERCREKQTLVKHMKRSHHESELPYSCDYCSYRSSEHKKVVDHFYEAHSKSPALQCPLCLKVVVIASEGDPLEKNIDFFLVHLQRHQKRTARKCTRCVLSFSNKMLIHEHHLRDHNSYRGAPELQPYADSGLCKIAPPEVPVLIAVPKLKLNLASNTQYKFEKFPAGVKMARDAKGLPCHECEVPLGVEDHMSGIFTCTSCAYQTCCINAMNEHAKCFHGVLSREPEYNISHPTILNTRMYCVCGFNSHSGNKLARHTALCKKISLYPSQEKADSARVVVKPTGSSALNILGLVRKNSGDTKPDDPKADEAVVEDEPELDTPPSDVIDATLEEDALNTDKPEDERDALQTTGEEEALEKDTEDTAVSKPSDDDAVETNSETLDEASAETQDETTTDTNEDAGETQSEVTGETEADNEALADAEILAEANTMTGEATETGSGADLDEDLASINNNSEEAEVLSAGPGDEGSNLGDALSTVDELSNVGDEVGENSNVGEEPSELKAGDTGDGNKATEEAVITETAGNEAQLATASEDNAVDVPTSVPVAEETDSVTHDIALEKASSEPATTEPPTHDESAEVGRASIEAPPPATVSSASNVEEDDDAELIPPPATVSSASNVEEDDDAELIPPPATVSSASNVEEDDDAELIKQDMAALQQDLAALSGTCDIPLNTILDRQMESSRGVTGSTSEIMDTTSPQPVTSEMESQDVADPGMEVEDAGSAASTTMECDSPGNNMLVE